MRDVVLVRTHKIDQSLLALYDHYELFSGLDVVFCCDERKSTCQVAGRNKISFDSEVLKNMNLLAHPNAGWLCGDYFYYVARSHLVNYDRYWLIEPDVRLAFQKPREFFEYFNHIDCDFIAPRFGARSPAWGWHARTARHFADVYGCVFSISRLSSRAVDHLVRARRSASAQENLATASHWPNDEGFVASELVRAGFSCKDFNDFGRIFHDQQTFRNGSIHSFEKYESVSQSGMIWHPVREFSSWIKGISTEMTTFGGNTRLHTWPTVPRHVASHLEGAAITLLEETSRQQSAVVPLYLARTAFSKRSWAASRPVGTDDRLRLQKVDKIIADHFEVDFPSDSAPTLYLARLAERIGQTQIANPSDFDLSDPMKVGNFPDRFAVPYAFDFSEKEVLYSLHIEPRMLLDAPFLYAAQREQTRVIARVPWGTLDSIFGSPSPGSRPILVFSIGRTGSTLLDSLVGCATPRAISEPDTVSQLGLQRRALARLCQAEQDSLVWHSIAPFFRMHISQSGDAPCVIKLRTQANGAISDLLRVFPNAFFVFMLRERKAWARSTYRAFRMPPDRVAARLAAGYQALMTLSQSPARFTVLHYEDVIANPQRAVAQVLDLPYPLDPDLQAKITAVMKLDSQAGSAVSRVRTAKPAQDEADWLNAFEAAWQSVRPNATIEALKLDVS